MKIRIKASDWNVDAQGNMEIMTNTEDFFKALDRISPSVLSVYMLTRLKDEVDDEAAEVGSPITLRVADPEKWEQMKRTFEGLRKAGKRKKGGCHE